MPGTRCCFTMDANAIRYIGNWLDYNYNSAKWDSAKWTRTVDFELLREKEQQESPAKVTRDSSACIKIPDK